MAKVITKIDSPAGVEITIGITLTLSDWLKVADALGGQEFHQASWPFFWLQHTINEQIRTAQKTFEAETENER